MGLSGSGKSTLIRHLNQLIRPTSGEIVVNNVNVTELNKKDLINFRRENFAMVFQKFALLPHRTVLSNTYFGLQIRGVKSPELENTAKYGLIKLGLMGLKIITQINSQGVCSNELVLHVHWQTMHPYY